MMEVSRIRLVRHGYHVLFRYLTSKQTLIISLGQESAFVKKQKKLKTEKE